METNATDEPVPVLRLNGIEKILTLFRCSGYEYIRSMGLVKHLLRKNGEMYGLIILHKDHAGYMHKFNEEQHFVDARHIKAFSKLSCNSVFIIVIEESSGETIIGCLGLLHGTKRNNKGVPVISYPRRLFAPIDAVLNHKNGFTTVDVSKLFPTELRVWPSSGFF